MPHFNLSFMRLLFITILVVFSFKSFSQANKIVGVWLSEEKTGKVEIYKRGDKYYGKIVWISSSKYVNGNPPKDINNPDKKLQTRYTLGVENLKDFVYDADDKEWDDGTIYDPKNGSTYDCYMWFEKENYDVLKIRGYIGISIIGRTTTWTRSSMN